ncbi:MAG: family N-acetyltransferase [Hyphomicrobiales bacterium]|jgi:putative hemolysin|nr:family N-acetyltransferase [Hyphomicrobiales bacterium]
MAFTTLQTSAFVAALGFGFAEKVRAFPNAAKPHAVRDHGDLDPVLGRIGALEVRLAITRKDIRRAQKLRYRVFFEEGGAIADARSALARRDVCPFDRICDHMLVIDHAAKNRFGRAKPKVVGAYRLLRKAVADRHGGFYSAQEFDIAPLLAAHQDANFLELGRSCVLAEYRSKRTIELLWRGIAAYVQHYQVDAMIGCASFEGANPLQHALALSFLHHHAQASGEWAARALPERHVAMDMIARDKIDLRRALDALPTLVRGYLRVGAKFGHGAVVDRQFGTVDVLVIMPVAQIDAKYLEHFSPAARAA